MDKETMLTTIDNPYNPHEDWDKWLLWDRQHYGTCEYLARVANVDDSMTEAEQKQRLDEAVDEIIMVNPLGIYVLV